MPTDSGEVILQRLMDQELDQDVLKFEGDGLDAAIVGWTTSWSTDGNHPLRLIYDYDLLVEAFIAQGMRHEDALEWIDFNVEGAYLGPQTPIIMCTN